MGAHDPPAVAGGDATLDDVLDELCTRARSAWSRSRPSAGARRPAQRLCEAGVVVSLGHTDATFDELIAGVDAGASLVTHLYNAMSPFHHREPGSVGAALTDDRLTVSVIADGVHAHPAALKLALRAKGWRGSPW